MTTLLEIVDTAVKIGFGALISGVTTYYVTCRNHDHDLNKTAIEDAIGILKEAALKLEKSSTNLNIAIEGYDHIALQSNRSDEDFKQILYNVLLAYNDGKDAKALFYLIGVPELGMLVVSYLEELEIIRERVRKQMAATSLDKDTLSMPSVSAQKIRRQILEAIGDAYDSIRERKQHSRCSWRLCNKR